MNPATGTIVAFTEGDVTRTARGSEAELRDELRRIAEWHRGQGDWVGIDTLRNDLRARLIALEVGELIAPATAAQTPAECAATRPGATRRGEGTQAKPQATSDRARPRRKPSGSAGR